MPKKPRMSRAERTAFIDNLVQRIVASTTPAPRPRPAQGGAR